MKRIFYVLFFCGICFLSVHTWAGQAVTANQEVFSGEMLEYGKDFISLYDGKNLKVLKKTEVLFWSEDFQALKQFEAQILNFTLTQGEEALILESGTLLKGRILSIKGSEVILDRGESGIETVKKSDLLAIYYGGNPAAVKEFFVRISEKQAETRQALNEIIEGRQAQTPRQEKKTAEPASSGIEEEIKKLHQAQKTPDEKKETEASQTPEKKETQKTHSELESWYVFMSGGTGGESRQSDGSDMPGYFSYGFSWTLSESWLFALSADIFGFSSANVFGLSTGLYYFHDQVLSGWFQHFHLGIGRGDGRFFVGRLGMGYAIPLNRSESAFLVGAQFVIVTGEQEKYEETYNYWGYFYEEEVTERVTIPAGFFYVGIIW